MSNVSFLDNDGTTRLSGSLVGLASVGVSIASVNVSAAEIMALDTTAKVLLPAPGGRFYYVVHALVAHLRFGTTPYDPGDARHLQIGYGTNIPDISTQDAIGVFAGAGAGFTGQTFLEQTADAYEVYAGPAAGSASGGYTNWLATVIENAPISLVNDGAAFTGGDSTLTIRLWYSLLDGAP